MNNIGWCYSTKGDASASLKQQEETLLVRRQLLEKFPKEFEAKRQISVSLGNLGSLYGEVGRSEEGIKYLLDGLAIDEELWKEHPNNRWVGLNLSNSFSNLSNAFASKEDFKKAIDYKTKAYQIRRSLFEDAKAGKPSEDGLGFFNFEDKYGKVSFELAGLLIKVEPENKDINGYLRTATDILASIHRKNAENDEYRALHAASLETQSRYLLSQGKAEDSLKFAESSHSVAVGKDSNEAEKLASTEHAMLREQQMSSTSLLAFCHATAREPDKSIANILEAADIYCRNNLNSGDASSAPPADLIAAVGVLGERLKVDPKVIGYLADKKNASHASLQKLKSILGN